MTSGVLESMRPAEPVCHDDGEHSPNFISREVAGMSPAYHGRNLRLERFLPYLLNVV